MGHEKKHAFSAIHYVYRATTAVGRRGSRRSQPMLCSKSNTYQGGNNRTCNAEGLIEKKKSINRKEENWALFDLR